MIKQIDLGIQDGDIAVENGQFKLSQNNRLIEEAVIRRIKTPLNSYSLYSVDINSGNVIVLDNEYGNISYELTALDSQLVQERLRDDLLKTLLLEPRIVVTSISLSNDIIEGISTIISYYIKDNEDLVQSIII